MADRTGAFISGGLFMNGEEEYTIPLDQRKNSGRWVRLGTRRYFDAASNSSNSITLMPLGLGVTVADAIRVVGPFPEEKRAANPAATATGAGPRP